MTSTEARSVYASSSYTRILLLLLFFAPGLFSLLLAPVEWGMALADGILGLWR